MDMSDEQAVRTVVEDFLAAVGAHDFDAIEDLVATNANVGWASEGDGGWSTAVVTAEDWMARGRAAANQTPYTEPVTDWTIHIDGGHLAFVRADAILYVGDVARRHNIDYFILVKADGAWKLVSLCYVGRAIEPG